MYKKLFVIIFIISLFLTGNVSAENYMQINEDITQLKQADTRVMALTSYFEKYNSPLRDEAENFVEAADKYNLDWKLVAAISGVESTFGKFTPAPKSYNAWGWGVYGNQALYFTSWKDGIYTVSKGLRTNYLDKGLTNPYTINRVYAASPAWGYHVSYFLADIEKFSKDYQDNLNKTTAPDINTKIAGTSAAQRE